MNHPNFYIFILLLLCGCSLLDKQEVDTEKLAFQNRYEFSTDSIGFDNPEEAAMEVLEFLKHRDTARYFDAIIPIEAQKYLFWENFAYRPDVVDETEFMASLEYNYFKRLDNFLTRAQYITEIMIEDNQFKIEEATIDTVMFMQVCVKNYGGFNRFIVGDWMEVYVGLNYNDEKYVFEVPQIIRVKNKWFLYYPEYYLRTLQGHINGRVIVNTWDEKADEFWY